MWLNSKIFLYINVNRPFMCLKNVFHFACVLGRLFLLPVLHPFMLSFLHQPTSPPFLFKLLDLHIKVLWLQKVFIMEFNPCTLTMVYVKWV